MLGAQLFDAFFQSKFADVDRYLSEIGDHPDILKIFYNLYQEVRNTDM
jgi:hypothetical protein